MTFETEFKIRTFHSDSFGHVNNARYLEIMEEARWQYAEHHGLVELLTQQQLGFIIVSMDIRFRAPVVEGDTICISTSLVTLGSASGEVSQNIRKKGETRIAARGLFHFVLIERDTGKSVMIAGKIRELLERIIEPRNSK
jgi:thioesterase-3